MATDQEKSFVEKRENERVVASYEVTFTVLSEEKALDLMKEGEYQDVLASAAHHQPDADMHELKSVTENVSITGLGLIGGLEIHGAKPAAEGDYLLLDLKIPDRTAIRAVARVVWSSEKDSEGQYRAGLFFEAISKEDVARVADQVRISKGEL